MDKKKDITKRYTKMASTIEDAKIYDGRGTYDLYTQPKVLLPLLLDVVVVG